MGGSITADDAAMSEANAGEKDEGYLSVVAICSPVRYEDVAQH